jgi:ubiquinone/menaquinone biosynthesis C-methylase UbiE
MFTHVFLTFGIMLMGDYTRALDGMYRVLEMGGRLAVTTWKVQGHWVYLTRAARRIFRDGRYPPPRFFHPNWLEGAYLARLMTLAGFMYDAGEVC